MDSFVRNAARPFAAVTPRRRALGLLSGGGMAALLGSLGEQASAKKKRKKKRNKNTKKPPRPALTFDLVRSQGAVADNCLADASGTVKIFELGFAERMEVSVEGLPANTEFDLFVIQVPDFPFGLSWYQGDMTTNGSGQTTESFIGRFNEETFIVAPGSAPAPIVHVDGDESPNPATGPIHTAHIGIWFNSPEDAEAAGCGDVVTPFNGDHTAGTQILSSRNFEALEGPLLSIGS